MGRTPMRELLSPTAPGAAVVETTWRRAAATLLLAALLLRLAPMAVHDFRPERVTTVDSAAYLELAEGLRQRGAFVHDGRPETFRTPGYPAFLALVSYLPGGTVPWALGLQALLDVTVVAAALVLGRRWGSPAAALAAGLLAAVDPAHLVASNLVMSDVLCAAAVAGAFALTAGRDRPGALAAPAAGLLLAAATAVRPVALPLVVPWALLAARRGVPRRLVAAAAVLALLAPAAWTVRNGLLAGRWTLSTAFDLNLGLVWAAQVEARGQGVALEVARERLRDRGAVFDPHADPAANRRLAARVVAEHPRAAARELVLSGAEMLLAGERRHALRLLGSPRGADRVASIGEAARGTGAAGALAGAAPGEIALVLGQLVFNGAVLLLAAAGAWRLARRREYLALGVLLAAPALVLAPSLVVATGRMRIPVSLFLAVLAGIGVAGAGAPRATDRRGSIAALL